METRSEYTPAIGRVARRELGAHGFTTYAQLAGVSERRLLEIHGVGSKAVRILAEELASRGMGFAPD